MRESSCVSKCMRVESPVPSEEREREREGLGKGLLQLALLRSGTHTEREVGRRAGNHAHMMMREEGKEGQ